jgi:putative DNA primase/helicase
VDNPAVVHQLGKQTARKILAEASTVGDDSVKGMISWARQTESRSRLMSIIALAAVEENIPIAHTDLDQDPWLLNVRNGTIDLRTGELRPHCRSDLITSLVPVTFDPKAQCPLYDEVLGRIFDDNVDLIPFWERLCGIALTGDVSEQILPILYGTGSNGKTTLVKTLVNLLGPDYAMIAPPGLLLVRRHEAHPTERASLFGKRLVVEMETKEGGRLNEPLVKHLTGSDPITARRMNEDFWMFNPTHKLWLCTNHKPEIKGTDHAIWRRTKLVPFGVTIPEDQADREIPEKLRAEYPGILAACVRACLDWQRNGLRPPEVVTEATKEYRAEQDLLGGFIADDCIQGPSFRVRSKILYEKYRERTQHLGGEPVSLTAFGLAMKERGFEKIENHGMWYLGIGLRQTSDTSPEAGYGDH